VEPRRRAAVGALPRLGFVVLACCVFPDLRLIVRRRLTEPCLGPTTIRYHIMRSVVQHSKIDRRSSAWGQNENPPFSGLCRLRPGADKPPAAEEVDVNRPAPRLGEQIEPRGKRLFVMAITDSLPRMA